MYISINIMEAYCYLMGFYKNNYNVEWEIKKYYNFYNSKVEKTLMDKMECIFFIAGVYDSYIGFNGVICDIYNLTKYYTEPKRFETHYKTLVTNPLTKGIYDEIYTNMKELMELSDLDKKFLELTYVSGRIRINNDSKLNDFILKYKKESETYSVIKSYFYIKGLIESYKREYSLGYNCF